MDALACTVGRGRPLSECRQRLRAALLALNDGMARCDGSSPPVRLGLDFEGMAALACVPADLAARVLRDMARAGQADVGGAVPRRGARGRPRVLYRPGRGLLGSAPEDSASEGSAQALQTVLCHAWR